MCNIFGPRFIVKFLCGILKYFETYVFYFYLGIVYFLLIIHWLLKLFETKCHSHVNVCLCWLKSIQSPVFVYVDLL